MLQKIRDNSAGMVTYILLGLLILAFAVWGIDFQFGGSDYLVKVNGEEVEPTRVSRAYQSQLQTYQRAYPEGIPTFQLEELKRNVLMASAREQLLYEHARSLGMRVSDEALAAFIAEQPGFQLGDEFSLDQFSLAADREGYSVQGFEEYIRRALLGQQLGSGLVQTAFVTAAERRRRGALEQESRTVSYYRIPASRYEADAEPDAEAIAAEYEADLVAFRTTESVKLEYIQLLPADLTRDTEIDEDTLVARYESAIENGVYVDEETRKASHILLAVQAGDSESDAAAKAEAESLLERIEGGEEFAALAAEFSDDPGTKNSGGELDWSSRAAFVGPFSDALFAMTVDEVRGPVRTTFGYHIIRLDGVRASEPKSFESVRDELLEQERLRLADEQIDAVSRDLDEAVYDNDDSLQPAADATGLRVQESDWITRSAGGGIGSSALVREAAFSDSVFLDRRNSQALRLEDGYVYIRVAEHRPSELQSLEAVTPQISRRLKRRAAAAAAAEAGAAAVERIQAGEDLAGVAADVEAEVTASQTASRFGGELEPALASAVFSAPAPVADEPSVDGAGFPNGDYAVFVIESAELGPEVADDVALRVAQTIGNGEFAAYIESLMADAEVEMRPGALQ